jgi:hypothetical protein
MAEGMTPQQQAMLSQEFWDSCPVKCAIGGVGGTEKNLITSSDASWDTKAMCSRTIILILQVHIQDLLLEERWECS